MRFEFIQSYPDLPTYFSCQIHHACYLPHTAQRLALPKFLSQRLTVNYFPPPISSLVPPRPDIWTTIHHGCRPDSTSKSLRQLIDAYTFSARWQHNFVFLYTVKLTSPPLPWHHRILIFTLSATAPESLTYAIKKHCQPPALTFPPTPSLIYDNLT